jgi:TRAP-type C4-dicarboxylate transport system substrate-binding protein
MPWPDVPQALQTGVISGLDHTPTICNITKKFTVAKNFTRVDYAQGLFVHLANKRWFDKLPADLQQILTEVVAEESAKAREATRNEQEREIAAAEAAGVRFLTLSGDEKKRLADLAAPVYAAWGGRIGPDYLKRVRTTLGN